MVSVILTLSLCSPLDATPTLNRYTHMRQSKLVQVQALIWMAEERMDLHLNEGKLEVGILSTIEKKLDTAAMTMRPEYYNCEYV